MSDPAVKEPGWEFTVAVRDSTDYFIRDETVVIVEARLAGMSNPDGFSMPPCKIAVWAPVAREVIDDPVAVREATRLLGDRVYRLAEERFRPSPPPVVDRHPRVARVLGWWDKEWAGLRRVLRAGRLRH